ncbi:MAG: UDP-N-acetylmuramate--L-alanine ligase [Bacillota bacterium]
MAKKNIYLIGIGGVSMSGIAKILKEKGYKVSGSDIKDSKRVQELKKIGINVNIGHNESNIKKKIDIVVISNAIKKKNVEYKKAKKLNLKILKRAEMIADLMKDKKGIAISGTHGKTTTTALISTMLKNATLNPTIMVGGDLDSINGNVYLGKGDYFVTEADESDGSFLYFDPYISVVTNIELDHINYYDSKEKLLNNFKKFIRAEEDDKKSIVCAEDKQIRDLCDLDNENLLSYGFNYGNIRASNIEILPFGSVFDVEYNNNKIGEISLQIPGKYNILNSLAAVSVGLYEGMSFSEIKRGIESFTGVKRRFEKKGLIRDILVVDDYAHHPTEIKETLKAAKNTGYNRIITVFQPHRYSRTKYLFDEFCNSFINSDHLIISDVYSADETIKNKEDKNLAKNMAAKCAKIYNFNVDYIENVNDIPKYLSDIIKSKDLVITIGAGDIYKSGENLIEKMKRKSEMA